MKLSIVIPVYRVEQYLAACVQSVLEQDWTDWEAILVDDGSPDRCGALCDAWAMRDSRIRAIHRENGGLSAARNTGIDAATGDYVLFLDSDDWLAPGALACLAETAQTDDSDMVLFDYARFDDAGTPLTEAHGHIPAGHYTRTQALALFAENRAALITACTKIYRRSLFDAVRFPEGKINEDEFTAHRFLAACRSLSVVEKPLYCYRDRPGSIMNTLSPYAAANVLFAFADRISLLRTCGVTTAVHRQEDNFWQVFKYRYPQLALGTAEQRARARAIRGLYLELYPALRADGILAADAAKALLLRYLPHLYAMIYRMIYKE